MTVPLREITAIVIHCSATPNGRATTIKDIDAWHQQRGWHRTDYFRIKKQFNPGLTSVGYHFFIDLAGRIHTGRHIDEIPAQVAGHNTKGIGICLAGNDRFTPDQWSALKQLVTQLQADIAASSHRITPRVLGHCDYPDAHKTCPNFSVTQWQQRGMVPTEEHILRI